MKLRIFGMALVAALLLLSQSTRADQITVAGVTYTLTAVGTDGPNTFDVDLKVDTTGASTNTPVLSSFSIQFTGATGVSIDSSASSGNIGTWSFIGNAP